MVTEVVHANKALNADSRVDSLDVSSIFLRHTPSVSGTNVLRLQDQQLHWIARNTMSTTAPARAAFGILRVEKDAVFCVSWYWKARREVREGPKSGRSRTLLSREKRGRFGRFGCGGEDRLRVGLQHSKPGREILRVIGAGIVGDAQIGAEESGSEFGDLSRQLDDQPPKGRRRPQYSSASMIVRTRVVFCGSLGSSEPYSIDLSK
jgi:hypothetical protein